jgi:apolipoprotein N-acyltransferase
MKNFILALCTVLLTAACTETPTPQEQKEVLAQATIKKNIDEAQKAKNEYLALQEKRRREGAI